MFVTIFKLKVMWVFFRFWKSLSFRPSTRKCVSRAAVWCELSWMRGDWTATIRACMCIPTTGPSLFHFGIDFAMSPLSAVLIASKCQSTFVRDPLCSHNLNLRLKNMNRAKPPIFFQWGNCAHKLNHHKSQNLRSVQEQFVLGDEELTSLKFSGLFSFVVCSERLVCFPQQIALPSSAAPRGSPDWACWTFLMNRRSTDKE